ncbi:hypothetical protein TI03_00015 [Achromatium sp. WMS1]|nr:hypothetical protein TI03_00015 [Achromatium sp. WMS1]
MVITQHILYQELLKSFVNIENLAGKAWEHACIIDFLNKEPLKDCSVHCFHYQQMLECFLKHILETKSELGFYSKSHELNRLLEQVISVTSFRTDKSKYRGDLNGITVCASEYRYNFDINCKAYFEMVAVCDDLLYELIAYEKT